jgi:hypothetical protein
MFGLSDNCSMLLIGNKSMKKKISTITLRISLPRGLVSQLFVDK